jgi:hypothetical protein
MNTSLIVFWGVADRCIRSVQVFHPAVKLNNFQRTIDRLYLTQDIHLAYRLLITVQEPE